jgi:isoleucyl-tRNA synthetase
VLVVPKPQQGTLKDLEDLFLELANVKTVGYLDEPNVPHTEAEEKRWKMASDGDLQVLLDTRRDNNLLGEGVMRDLARRVQALRKELGFTPTDVLEAVHLAELDEETTKLLEPYLQEMAELVRTKKVNLHKERTEVKTEWHEYALDNKRMYVAIRHN